jgi:hypothetical protein
MKQKPFTDQPIPKSENPDRLRRLNESIYEHTGEDTSDDVVDHRPSLLWHRLTRRESTEEFPESHVNPNCPFKMVR